ncbi:MAG: hypothetical protein JO363_07355, partial [Solirubrobacterales bacterium]|nr:hypothetical protein [Solirubrobacterales bacterium]
ERMYGIGEPSITDRLIDFVTADTGSFYVVPSIEALEAIGVTPPTAD